MKTPEDLPCYCPECDWKGRTSDCKIESDSEGWEYPDYIVFICPNCGGITEI